jgi:hypothetical protein
MTGVIIFEDYKRELEARLRALGYTGNDFVAPNSGVSRTPAKRELLRTLAQAARKSGREPVFRANY